ncbi:SpoVA/SpoVAEb family sporulation membrane protein, partial [Bacillus sp. B-TM1]
IPNPVSNIEMKIRVATVGFGIYDRFGQFAGAGTAVPVTGFGNSVIAACIEHRTEGFVLGVGGNMFKLAGSVILFGVFSAFVIALIKTILVQWGGL